MSSDAHRWTFFRAGDFDQVKLASGADLANLGALDQKLWVALACPTNGLEIDARTLALIDTDKDGRVRAPELIAAATFACNNLKNPDDLFKGEAALPLAAINDALPEGKTLLASARRILADIGKTDFTSISLDDVGDPARIFADTVFNGDGVITEIGRRGRRHPRARSARSATRIGTVPDRSGKPGIDGTITDAFFAEARAYSAWYARGEESPANVFPLGPERTASAAAAVAAIKPKVDDYFGRCRLAAFDPRAAAGAQPQPGGVPPDRGRRPDASRSRRSPGSRWRWRRRIGRCRWPARSTRPTRRRSGRSATTPWRRCSARAPSSPRATGSRSAASSRRTTPGSR